MWIGLVNHKAPPPYYMPGCADGVQFGIGWYLLAGTWDAQQGAIHGAESTQGTQVLKWFTQRKIGVLQSDLSFPVPLSLPPPRLLPPHLIHDLHIVSGANLEALLLLFCTISHIHNQFPVSLMHHFRYSARWQSRLNLNVLLLQGSRAYLTPYISPHSASPTPVHWTELPSLVYPWYIYFHHPHLNPLPSSLHYHLPPKQLIFSLCCLNPQKHIRILTVYTWTRL